MPFISRGTSMRASPHKKQFILQSMIQLIALSPFLAVPLDSTVSLFVLLYLLQHSL